MPGQLDASDDRLHRQRTLDGPWITCLHGMDPFCEDLDAWGLLPHDGKKRRFPPEQALEAYALTAAGRSGNVVFAFGD